MTYENLDDIVFALQQYDELLEKFPANVDLLLGKAEILEGLGSAPLIKGATTNPYARFVCYERILAAAPKTFEVWPKTLEKAVELCVANNFQSKLDYLILHYPIKKIACEIIIKKIWNKNLSTLAILSDWLLRLDTDNYHGHVGKVLAIQNQKQQALQYCDELIQRCGAEFWPWYIKAAFLSTAYQQHEEALLCLEEASKRPKTNSAAAFADLAGISTDFMKYHIKLLLKLGKTELALAIAPNNVTKAEIYYKTKNYLLAKDFAIRAVSENINNPAAHKMLGDANYALEKFANAARAYSNLAMLAPNDADAWYLCGKSTMRLTPLNAATLESALQCFKQATKLGCQQVTKEYLEDIKLRINVLRRRLF